MIDRVRCKKLDSNRRPGEGENLIDCKFSSGCEKGDLGRSQILGDLGATFTRAATASTGSGGGGTIN